MESAATRTHTDTLQTPTWTVATAIYLTYGLTTWFFHDLPVWLAAGLCAYCIAWHNSLQHEVIHGHPSRHHWLNQALVFPSLHLWLPFGRYRRLHLLHHRHQHLTDPLCDPETYYLTAEQWAELASWQRSLCWIHNTVLGRLLLGPVFIVWRFYRAELRQILDARQPDIRQAWLAHLPAVAIVLAWLQICQLPLWQYLLLGVYPALALTLLRSYAEHRAAARPEHRSAIVEAGPLFSLLYLNNNLHALHHVRPDLPWFRLPDVYRQRRAALLQANDGYRYRGYAEIIARYLLWPKEPPWHPGGPPRQPSPAEHHPVRV